MESILKNGKELGIKSQERTGQRDDSWLKASAAKGEGPSSIPGTHVVEGKTRFTQVVL